MYTSVKSNLIYRYDGSFEGLLTCVYEAYANKESPSDIFSPSAEISLFPTKEIETQSDKAQRVLKSIASKISKDAEELVKLAFLTCLAKKELHILHFLQLGYQHGAKVFDMLANETVSLLHKAVKYLDNESHLLKGFVRFSISENVLTAVIEPNNFVLPLLAQHFCTRYNNEVFMIYDKTHKMALVYQNKKHQILPIDELILPAPDAEEQKYRNLWRKFYQTIAIEGRENPLCRMTHMPKRYWKYLTEFQEDETNKNLFPQKSPEKCLKSQTYQMDCLEVAYS